MAGCLTNGLNIAPVPNATSFMTAFLYFLIPLIGIILFAFLVLILYKMTQKKEKEEKQNFRPKRREK